MRTTLSIDDDVLQAAKTLAEQQDRSLGEIVSALARRGLEPRPSTPQTRNGISLLPQRKNAKPVTSDVVKQLCDELP